jgi:hypothetical protein
LAGQQDAALDMLSEVVAIVLRTIGRRQLPAKSGLSSCGIPTATVDTEKAHDHRPDQIVRSPTRASVIGVSDGAK